MRISLLAGLAACTGVYAAAAREQPQPATTNAPCAVAGGQTAGTPFAGGDLFATEYKNPAKIQGKQLWAASFLYAKAPKLVVEEWIGSKPDTKGKYVLIEVWNTWCPPCRHSIALLNGFHEKYGKELVVIGLCDESREAVMTCMARPNCKIKYFNAIDTAGTTRKALNVVGVPHAIVIEPGGYVVWEGFPLQPGYELTDDIIGKILAVGRQQAEEKGT